MPLALTSAAPVLAVEMILTPPSGGMNSHFLDTGFPSCLRYADSTFAGGEAHLILSDMPQAWYASDVLQLASSQGEVTQYSPLLPIYMRFDGSPSWKLLSEQSFPEQLLEKSVEQWPAVFLIKLDDSQNSTTVPIAIRLTDTDDPCDYRRAGTLSAVAKKCLLESDSCYALVVMDQAVEEAPQEEAKCSSFLECLLETENSSHSLCENYAFLEDYRKHYQLLRDWLKQHNCPAKKVLGAVCWKTGHPEQFLSGFIDLIDNTSMLYPNKLKLVYSPRDSGEYDVYKGTMVCPQWQRLNRPVGFLVSHSGHRIETDTSHPGGYKSQGTRKVPVTLTLPKGYNLSEGKINLVQYHHGTSGGSDEPYTRGRISANGHSNENSLASHLLPAGWAVICAGTFMGWEHEFQPEANYVESRIAAMLSELVQPCTDFSLALNHTFFRYGYLPGMESNMLQSLLERRMLDNMIREKKIQLKKNQTAAVLEPERHMLLGHSFGAMTAGVFVGHCSSHYQGAIFSGAGNFGLGLPVNFLAPLYGLNAWSGWWNFGITPQKLLLDFTHPVWMLAELYLSRISPVLLLARKPPDIPMLFISGIDDNQVPDFMQQPFLQACGVDISQPDKTITGERDQLDSEQTNAKTWIRQQLETKKKILVRFGADEFSRNRPVNSHNTLFQFDTAGQIYAGFAQCVAEQGKRD